VTKRKGAGDVPSRHDYRANPVNGAGPYMGMVQNEFRLKDRIQQFLDQYDATFECVHGNLPGRPQNKVKCDCFRPPHQKAKAS
jgi:hypothetical protein